MTSEKNKSRILLTSGEPAGIGPDLVIKLSQMNHDYDVTVIGDPELLNQRAKILSIPIDIEIVSENNTPNKITRKKTLKVLPIELNVDSKPGILDIKNVDYVIKMLDIACKYCIDNKYDVLITTPIQKSIINDAGIRFSGHTEYLAKICNVNLPVMLLACQNLRVALVTTHIPLIDVPKAISKNGRIKNTINIVIEEMKSKFCIERPRVTVCGLNPHAGEDGYLGNEEKKLIAPVINEFIKMGHDISGPVPADTAFIEEKRKKTDVYVAMYHDQGLPVLKTLGFGEAVNVTLGLPIIRASVDHGTALKIAGTGKAECSSLMAAISMADKMKNNEDNFRNSSNVIAHYND